MDPVSTPVSQKQYQIQQGSGRQYLAPSPSPFVFRTLNACSWSLWVIYICYQFYFVLLNYGVFLHWRIYAAILAEALVTFPEMLFLLGTTIAIWELPKSSNMRRSYYLKGDVAPEVDVFITCAGEPVSVVVDTVRAATAQDYPTTSFRVLVLDDGDNQDLRQALCKLSKEPIMEHHPAVRYLARPPDDHNFGKAGNLQYGIERTRRQINSDFVASLDADMIVEPDWLRRMIPHALVDDTIGLVNPPQVRCMDGAIQNNQHNQCADAISFITTHQRAIHSGVKQIWSPNMASMNL